MVRICHIRFRTFHPVSQTLAFHGRANDTMGTVGGYQTVPVRKRVEISKSRISARKWSHRGVFIGLCSPQAMASLKKRTCRI